MKGLILRLKEDKFDCLNMIGIFKYIIGPKHGLKCSMLDLAKEGLRLGMDPERMRV